MNMAGGIVSVLLSARSRPVIQWTGASKCVPVCSPQTKIVPVPRRAALIVARDLLHAERRALVELRRQHDLRKARRQRLRQIDDTHAVARDSIGEFRKQHSSEPASFARTARARAPSRCRASGSTSPARHRPDKCLRRRRAAPLTTRGQRRRRKLGRRHELVPFLVDRAGKNVDDANAGVAHARRAGFATTKKPRPSRPRTCLRRQCRQRVDRQQIDPRGRAGTCLRRRARASPGRTPAPGAADRNSSISISARAVSVPRSPRCRGCDAIPRC